MVKYRTKRVVLVRSLRCLNGGQVYRKYFFGMNLFSLKDDLRLRLLLEIKLRNSASLCFYDGKNNY